jgi:hypothetical protein
MTIWGLLLLINSGGPILGSAYYGSKLGGLTGAIIGLTLGLLIGVTNYFLLRAIGRKATQWCLRRREAKLPMRGQKIMEGFLQLLFWVWAFASIILGQFMVQWLVKLNHS